jgi:hypothetical protein
MKKLCKIEQELEKQDTKIHKFQQQIKESQQQISNIKNTHKKESENINKKLLSKDEEISRLRNHNKNLLVDMKKLKNKRKAQQETQTMDKGTSTDLIDMEKPNVVINEVVSVEEPPKVEIEDKVTSIEGIKTKNQITNEVLLVEEFPEVKLNKQFYDKATSTDLVEVDIPLITTNKVIGQSKDVVTPINTKKSDIIMMTQVNHDKTKPDIKKDKIPRHPKIYVPQSQQKRRTYPKSYHQRVLEKIHLGWIDSFSMHNIVQGFNCHITSCPQLYLIDSSYKRMSFYQKSFSFPML